MTSDEGTGKTLHSGDSLRIGLIAVEPESYSYSKSRVLT